MTDGPSLGLSPEMLTLPHEDPGDHARLFQGWTDAYPKRDPILQGLILQAVMALIEMRRLARIRATVRTEKVRTAVLRWEHAQDDNVTHWLQQFNVDPGTALIGLLRTAAGCRWALEYLEKLQKLLNEQGTWYGIDVIGAIQIQGFSGQVKLLYYSEEAYNTWLDCLGAQPNAKQADIDRVIDPWVIPLAMRDRGVQVWPREPAECRARLQAMLDREIPRIRAIEETLRVQYEEPSRAEAETMALAGVTKEEMQLLRAQRIHEQSYLQASAAIRKFHKPIPASRAAVAAPALVESRLASSRLARQPGESEHRAAPVVTITAASSFQDASPTEVGDLRPLDARGLDGTDPSNHNSIAGQRLGSGDVITPPPSTAPVVPSDDP